MVNQIGASTAGKMKSFQPARSADVDIQTGQTEKWGLGFLINTVMELVERRLLAWDRLARVTG